MYSAYFVNVQTGELKRTSNPKDNPVVGSGGWKQISGEEYQLFAQVASYYVRDFKIQTNETGFYNDTK